MWEEDDSGAHGASIRLGKSGDARAVTALLTAIKDRNPMVREVAAAGLGYVHDRRATDALIGALQDEHLSESASFSLFRLRDPHSVGPVLEILKSPSAQVRSAAVRALSRIGDPRAASALYSAVRDPDERVRALAMRAVAEFDDSRSLDFLVSALGGDPVLGGGAADALANRADGKGIDSILAIINDPYSKIWRTALTTINYCTDLENMRKLVIALCGMLKYGATEIQIRAADGLGLVRDLNVENERAVDELIEKIKSPNREVRWAAVRGLRYRPGSRAFDTMLAFAADAGSEFHREALLCMRTHNNPLAFGTLLRCIYEKDESARSFAAYDLSALAEARMLDSATAADTLAATASRHNPVLVRRAALDALAKIRHPRAIVLLVGILNSETDRTARELVKAGLAQSDVPGLENILSDELQKDPGNSDLRNLLLSIRSQRQIRRRIPASIIRTLGQNGDEAAMSVFGGALRELNVSIEAVTMTDPAAGSGKTLASLVAALHDPLNGQFAAAALGVLGDRRAVDSLIGLLKPPPLRFRFSERPDVPAQAAAAAALGCLGDRRAVPVLETALAGTSPRISTAAAIALGELRDAQAVGALIRALEYQNMAVRHAAARALGEICDVRAIEPLKACLSVFRLAPAAASSLERLGWHPQSEREQVYIWLARDDWDRITANRDIVRSVLIEDLAGNSADAVENAALALVALGVEDAMPGIIGAMNKTGNPLLATLYYNTGRADLQRAASQWLREDGEEVTMPWEGRPALLWASCKSADIRSRHDPDLWSD